MFRTSRVAFLTGILSLSGAAALSGCSSAGDGAGALGDAESTGEIGLSLSAGGVTLNSASYAITGPGGFKKTGNIELSHSTTLSATISGIPVGVGYSISITSTAADGATSCAGSASFDVVAKQTTPVALHLVCHQPTRTGSISINGSVNVCPVVDALSASPSEVIVGGTLTLTAAAHDSDAAPAAIAYHWSATSGSFDDAAAASPVFTCAAPGLVTITISASDGDPAPGCADTASTQVKCSLPGAGSAAPSTLAVYGDAPYGTSATDTSQTVATPAFISAVNADPAVSLVLHVGDIHSGKQFCTQAYDQTIFDLWKAYQRPLVYTPGDNEWADCHKVAEGGGAYNALTQQIDFVKDANGNPVDYANGDPIANLALVRSIFFPQVGLSLGSQKMPVLSQAQIIDSAHPSDAAYVENVMFEQSKVLFVTLNLPGGSNNDDDVWYGAPSKSAAQVQEIADRTGADLRWLDLAFQQAQADGVVAVVIDTQADMWDSEKGAAHQALYEPIVQSVATHTTAFAKPVLMFNGDSHVYKSDSPLSASDPLNFMHPGYDVPNFHRIVVHGSTLPLEYLRFTVDPSQNAPLSDTAFGPFSWARVIP